MNKPRHRPQMWEEALHKCGETLSDLIVTVYCRLPKNNLLLIHELWIRQEKNKAWVSVQKEPMKMWLGKCYDIVQQLNSIYSYIKTRILKLWGWVRIQAVAVFCWGSANEVIIDALTNAAATRWDSLLTLWALFLYVWHRRCTGLVGGAW